MSSVHLIFAIAGLLFPVAVAVDCVGDELSLVQTKHTVRHGKERAETDTEYIKLLTKDAIKELVNSAAAAALKQAEEEVGARGDPEEDLANWRAITDSVPGGLDEGEVTSSWASNLEKAKDNTEESAADDLSFDEDVYHQRVADKDATAEQLGEINEAVKDDQDADNKAVDAAWKHRIAVHKVAAKYMARAKEAWEAHSIKKKQAQAAALEGKWEGDQEGAADAASKLDAWEDSVIDAAADSQKAAKKAAAAKKLAGERDAIEKHVDDLEKAAEGFADRDLAVAEGFADRDLAVDKDFVSGADELRDGLE